MRGHGYVQVDNPVYCSASSTVAPMPWSPPTSSAPDLAEALKAEARRRAADGAFYGTITHTYTYTYTSTTGHKPDR